nr:hypothetical protein [Amycolatopsis taiwanensis]
MTCRVYVEVYEQGRARSAAVVHGDLSYAGPRHAGIPGAVEVPGLNRRARPGGEDQFRSLPRRAGRLDVTLLFLLPFAQGCGANADQGERVIRGFGLGFTVE